MHSFKDHLIIEFVSVLKIKKQSQRKCHMMMQKSMFINDNGTCKNPTQGRGMVTRMKIDPALDKAEAIFLKNITGNKMKVLSNNLQQKPRKAYLRR